MPSRNDDTPALGEPGTSDTFVPAEVRAIPDVSGDERLFGLIIDAVQSATAGGSTSEDAYQRALEQLRERRDDVGTVLHKTYLELREDAYAERWVILQLLTDLRLPEAMDALVDIARSPLPEEKSEDPAHGFSTVAEELILRTTAAEGLSRMLADGDPRAGEVLNEMVRHESLTIARAAWLGIVDAADGRFIELATNSLRDSDRAWLLDLTRVSVREVEQADPRKTVRAARRATRRAPAPSED
jgi:hypothetical protein